MLLLRWGLFVLYILLIFDISWSSNAHCTEKPELKITGLRPGVSVEEMCFYNFAYCLSDTFYRTELEQLFHQKLNQNKFGIVAIIDSVHIWWQDDTTRYLDSKFSVWKNQHERVYMRVLQSLKGGFHEKTLDFHEKWYFLSRSPETTYDSLVGYPLFIFFDSAIHMSSLGIFPTDCRTFFEATANIVTKRGLGTIGLERMPGVYLDPQKFLNSIGISDLKLPSIPIKNRIVKANWAGKKFQLNANSPIDGIQIIDVNGKILQNIKEGNRLDLNLSLNKLPRGIYILEISAKGWKWREKIFLGDIPQQKRWVFPILEKN